MSTRCATCNKKTGIVQMWLVKHRHPEDHSCRYDFKTNERNKLNEILTSNNESTKKLNMNQNSGGNCAS